MNIRIAFSTLALAGLAAAPALAESSNAATRATPSLAITIAQIANELRALAPVACVTPTNESIRYRPRWRESSSRGGSPGNMNGYVQLHGGVFDPAGDVSNGALFGLRVGTNVDERVQVGGQLDWSHRGDRQTAVVGSGALPGGGSVERRRELSSVSSDLVPLMAFVQVSPTGTRQGPYIGLAGGYQALFVSAQDFSTGEDFSATYDGWGWQFYGGYAFPLSGVTRLTVEAFTNSAELDRKVDDPLTGVTYREIVDGGGSGLRGGVSWSF